ncbi:putative mitochondrial protein AtMg00860 [Bidens hawaiensis]|uniref:putative mitochondrial protein AtMg00860 n=1 Tax=Bidens hawaiensis TaxID=980011 RepID=UPI004049FF2D
MAETNEVKDVPVVQDYPEVFPKDLPGLLPERENESDHVEHLKEVLEILKEEKLYVRFSKCAFWLREVQFIGHVINPKGITVDPSKIEGIMNWKTPQSLTDVRSFLGLVGYYRKFIEGLSKVAALLPDMTRKSVVFNWGKYQEEALKEWKKRLTQAPNLALPDGNKDLVVCTDALHRVLGCVLMQ